MSCVTSASTNAGDTIDDSDSFLNGIAALLSDDFAPPLTTMAAYTAVSIQAHVPIKLELRSSNYTK